MARRVVGVIGLSSFLYRGKIGLKPLSFIGDILYRIIVLIVYL